MRCVPVLENAYVSKFDKKHKKIYDFHDFYQKFHSHFAKWEILAYAW